MEQRPHILSPEGVLVLFVAILLDVLGVLLIFLPGLGWITTVLGFATLGVWSWYRFGHISMKQRAKKYIRRVGLNMVGEILTAGLYPGWTILALSQLDKS